MEVVCWRMKMHLTIFSFLQWWKQTRNEMKFQLHSFCFSFLQCLMIVSNSRKTKPIVILFLLDCDLRKRGFDQIGRNHRNLNRICKACFEFVLFSFFISIWGLLKTRNVERGLKSACSQQLVKFEKERKKRKKRKDCQIHFHPSTNNFHSFSLIQYHQTNHSQSQSNHDENEKRKRWKWTSSTTIEQIETPSFNARVERGRKQTTLPQLPAFPAFCKCNEHPITSNAHWYPSGHSCRPKPVPLML